MKNQAKIKKALVVLSPDLIRPDNPLESTLLRRAVELAKKTGCSLELFHVCYDGSLDFQLFTSDDEMRSQQEALTDRDSTLLSEVAARLQEEHVIVRHEVRWDSPRSDAILRKIADSQPDVVLKQSREHSFMLGITSNTDWDLARRSTAHVWLVNKETPHIKRIVAAVGNQSDEAHDVTTATDYKLFQTAGIIANAFAAEIHPVNAYQVPVAQPYLASAGGLVASAIPNGATHEAGAKRLKRHKDAVNALAEFFHIDNGNVHIREGHPDQVIPEFAQQIDADMIIMGSSNISRLERLVNSVVVEPVIGDANCDILIVREDIRAAIPVAAAEPIRGIPRYDLELAVTDPAATFRTPVEVATHDYISSTLKERILQAWEYNVRAKLNEDNEGGPPRGVNSNILGDIQTARTLLAARKENDRDEGARLTVA